MAVADLEKDWVYLNIDDLYPHPENPRLDLGDLEELTDSIEKNGIMQNLTVTPDEDGKYRILIGHRRCEAAKKAGLTQVPCMILDGITHEEELAIMLEENMQREDLSIYEQAQGFQMMLDLGQSEEDIADKTGFSKTTIKRRVEIAKLDKDKLKEKTDDASFQLSLTDLYELGKVEDIEERNKILSEATDSNNLVWRARRAEADAKRNKNYKAVVEEMEALGIAEGDDSVNAWSGKWEKIFSINIDEDFLQDSFEEAFTNTEGVSEDEYSQYVFKKSYTSVEIYKKKKVEKKEEVKTPEQLAKEEKDRNKKHLDSIGRELAKDRKMFVLKVLEQTGKISEETDEKIWKLMLKNASSLSSTSYLDILSEDKDDFWKLEDTDKAKCKEKFDNLDQRLQRLVALIASFKNTILCNYDGTANNDKLENIRALNDILAEFGYSPKVEGEDDLQAVFDGTSGLYWMKKEEGAA